MEAHCPVFFCSCNLRVLGFLHMDQRSVGIGNKNPDFFGGSSPVTTAKFLFWVRDKGGFPSDSDGKESACNEGDLGSIPGLGRSSGGGHDNSLQYSCLETSPWTEEPGGLQAMGSQRVRHDWASMHTHTHTHTQGKGEKVQLYLEISSLQRAAGLLGILSGTAPFLVNFTPENRLGHPCGPPVSASHFKGW